MMKKQTMIAPLLLAAFLPAHADTISDIAAALQKAQVSEVTPATDGIGYQMFKLKNGHAIGVFGLPQDKQAEIFAQVQAALAKAGYRVERRAQSLLVHTPTAAELQALEAASQASAKKASALLGAAQ